MRSQQSANVRRRAESIQLWEQRRLEIERLYLEQGLSQQQVADHFGITQTGLQQVMKRLGIQARPRANYGARNGRYKDGSQARGYRTMVRKDHCNRCGTTSNLGIHHKNDDHYDNRPENLEVLCNSCHMSETKQKWWDAKKAGLPLPKSNGPVGWTR